jgi:urate oxidase
MNKVLLFIAIILIVLYFIPVYNRPKVIKNIISDDECEHIKKIASKKLHTSTVSKSMDVDENIRKSKTAWIKPSEDLVVNKLVRKCISMTDRPLSNCEDLQVLKYKPGGFYKPHQDAFAEDKNRRMYTFIIALNDEYEGGETIFPNINKKYKLEKGDALFFNTLNNYECMTKKALHGGEPVKSGEKWICNLWVRKYPY